MYSALHPRRSQEAAGKRVSSRLTKIAANKCTLHLQRCKHHKLLPDAPRAHQALVGALDQLASAEGAWEAHHARVGVVDASQAAALRPPLHKL